MILTVLYISTSQLAPTSHDLMLQHCRQHDLLRLWSFGICFKLLHGCAGSISYNSWMPAEVLGWNSELHCYILNIQAVAAPHKVRFVFEASTNGGDMVEMKKTSRWGRRQRVAPLWKWQRHKNPLSQLLMCCYLQCILVCWVGYDPSFAILFAKEPCVTISMLPCGSSLCMGCCVACFRSPTSSKRWAIWTIGWIWLSPVGQKNGCQDWTHGFPWVGNSGFRKAQLGRKGGQFEMFFVLLYISYSMLFLCTVISKKLNLFSFSFCRIERLREFLAQWHLFGQVSMLYWSILQ